MLSMYAKSDFYYSFIDSSGNQIPEQMKQKIRDGYDILKNAKELIKNNDLDEAYAIVKDLKATNKLKILDSDIILLYCDILLKKRSKRFIDEAAYILEDAINSSKIHEKDLPKAYMLLVDLKLELNKAKEARYFAQIIINNFDDPLTKAYGKIYLSKVYTKRREYNKAVKILYKILTETSDMLVATIVADHLYDIYILSDKREKAYELISKVLHKNIDYYANDSYIAIQKVNKLIRAGMPEFAVKILQELLTKTNNPDSIEDFKFKLAGTYMLMYDKTPYYLLKAKEIYKDLLTNFSKGAYIKKVKMFLDEILMREGKIEPSILAEKYRDSASMQQKVLLQELMNDKQNGRYSQILLTKKIYKKISNRIVRRFGYKSMNDIFDEVNILMIKDYLRKGKCSELNKALKTARTETLYELIENKKLKYQFFECLIEVPYERGYLITKEAFNKSRDAKIYLYLERMAMKLDLIDEAYSFSQKVEMVGDKDILAEEFLYRFLLYGKMNETLSMDKFFSYASRNSDLIDKNIDNPLIIDFYYQYYLYLLKKDKTTQAKKILIKLYKKQKEVNARVYSPFVELELARYEKEDQKYKKALEFLEEPLKSKRRIKKDDLVHLYYELAKTYRKLDKENKYKDSIQKCKGIKGVDDNMYKKMCDKL